MAGVRRSVIVMLATIFAAGLTISQSFAFMPTAGGRSVIRSHNERQVTHLQYRAPPREACEARQLTMKKKRRGGAGGASFQQIINSINEESGLPLDENKVMIGKLDASWTEEEVKEFASAAGPVVSIKYIQRKNSKSKSRGFAFVEYEQAEKASNAIQQLRFTPFNGRAVEVKAAFEDQKEKMMAFLKWEKENPEKVAKAKAELRGRLTLA